LPGWQAFHAEYEAAGFTVVSVALDIDPDKARPWIEAAAPAHPSLIDTAHRTDELFGFNNVPMAVWIDESGSLVRPAEAASIETSPLRNMDIPEDLPPPIHDLLTEAREIPDIADNYRAALLDWIEKGSDSAYAMTPDEVIAASLPRQRHHAEAAANFEMGQTLFQRVGKAEAVPYWRAAHTLDPENWTYKRQAWTLETTPEGQPSDLIQAPTEIYEGSWLADVKASGGGAEYITKPGFVTD